MVRVVLSISYSGTAYQGWQSQISGKTVQDRLEHALKKFTGLDQPVRTVCAGRTDAGVHALNQVVHFDTELEREAPSWVRATNRYLPSDIAVQWCHFVPESFHARKSATNRKYVYIVMSSPVRPSIETNRVGWCWQALDQSKMLEAASYLVGEHDFSAFRSSECQSPTPIKDLRRLHIEQHGAYWCFEFEANAFLQHMIRNLMGGLLAVGSGKQSPQWIKEVLESRKRELAAPTFTPDGLYFLGPQYETHWGLPMQDKQNIFILPVRCEK